MLSYGTNKVTEKNYTKTTELTFDEVRDAVSDFGGKISLRMNDMPDDTHAVLKITGDVETKLIKVGTPDEATKYFYQAEYKHKNLEEPVKLELYVGPSCVGKLTEYCKKKWEEEKAFIGKYAFVKKTRWGSKQVHAIFPFEGEQNVGGMTKEEAFAVKVQEPEAPPAPEVPEEVEKLAEAVMESQEEPVKEETTVSPEVEAMNKEISKESAFGKPKGPEVEKEHVRLTEVKPDVLKIINFMLKNYSDFEENCPKHADFHAWFIELDATEIADASKYTVEGTKQIYNEIIARNKENK